MIKQRVLILAVLYLGQYNIRIDVPFVSLDVRVADSAGRPVTNLTKDDFLVYEDGQLQNLQTFASADSPYDLILLSDCSDSTLKEWPLLKAATQQLLKHRKPQDRTLIAAFGSQVQVIRNWNSKRENELNRDWICSGTRFYEALNWAIQKLNGVKGRKGVVMMTDGVDNSIPTRVVKTDGGEARLLVDSKTDKEFQKALRLVSKGGIPFYFVAVGTDRNPDAENPPVAWNTNPREMRLRLEQLADVSGGGVVFPTKPADVIPMYERIGRELGSSYTLGYSAPNPKADGKRHRIEVRLNRANLTLTQSRTTYTAN